ncbi:MAG TPA: hypothetical protein VLA75_09685, partial [Thermoanaerobaculia bacterium]|nr:hypothetical protein [Thermoanaerobaculia bacterium]
WERPRTVDMGGRNLDEAAPPGADGGIGDLITLGGGCRGAATLVPYCMQQHRSWIDLERRSR